jgi:hypothetical protein
MVNCEISQCKYFKLGNIIIFEYNSKCRKAIYI